MRKTFWFQAVLVPALMCLPAAAQQRVEFNRDIRPILSENCFACHGPDSNARQAGLRLDRRQDALDAGAIVPGDLAVSKMAQRIGEQQQEALRMPPVYSNKKLSGEQRELLLKWIEQGGEYQLHWSYIRPEKGEAPAGPAAIDALLEAELARRGLDPAAIADRRTLARRVSFDLTGLPPDPDRVEAFVVDSRADAYERLVDELLDSPHYGERMATPWLDLVRYADTVGFHSDVPVNVYPYRDYVIGAFNENLPFDQFTREQLAGDLLPNPTVSQKVASGYNRLNRMTNEGGSQAKEYLVKYAGDRVRTTATAWLGSTLGCAECHDHKFDPFKQKDFYQMAAFFADIEESGVYAGRASFGSSVRVLSPAARAELKDIDKTLARLRSRSGSADRGELAGYLRDQAAHWRALEPERVWSDCEHPDLEGCEGFTVAAQDGGYLRIKVKAGENLPREALIRAEYASGEAIRAFLYEAYPVAGFDEFELSEFEVRLLGRERWPLPVKVESFVPDAEQPGSMLRDAADGNHHTGWGGRFSSAEPRRGLFVPAEPLRLRAGERLEVAMVYNGRTARRVAGRVRLSASDSEFPEIPARGWLRSAVLNEQIEYEAERHALDEAFAAMTENRSGWREIRRLERRRKDLLDQADESLISSALDEPRTIRVLARGNWMDESGEIVEPQPPGFLSEGAGGERRATRLDLAEWIVSTDNPLTARVFVNRLWKMYFHTGLSKSLDDLGSQGESPLQQGLLDWLAVEFMESGWDVKHIVRTMLLSEAYQRSTNGSPELVAADPYNRLHGRQAAARLDAEFIRDSALAVAGLLNRKIGGPSAKPYQPAGYYQELNFPRREYQPAYDENQFRRGLYTHWQRTYLHPSLMAFDAPSREECTAERAVSNTPLQSLALLNDPSYIEAARAFAGRILSKQASGDVERVEFAVREAFARPADEAERAILLELLEQQRRRFRDDPAGARELLQVGISPASSAGDSAELAAWTSVARALFNKHEFVTRY